MARSKKSAIAAGVIQGVRSLGRSVGTALGPAAERRLPRLHSYLVSGLTVFVFHEITDHPSEFQRQASIYTTPAMLEQQLRWVRERFDVIPPTRLNQLGADHPLPARAALVTFDDAWAGVFTTGVSILVSLGVPALCFINTASVQGAPDLGAVRYYERRHDFDGAGSLEREQSLTSGTSALDAICERYRDDPEFAAFQGATATSDDLARAAGSGAVWFGRHLHHHWDLTLVDDQLYEASLEENGRALEVYGNSVAAFAPPYGRPNASLWPIASRAGVRAVFLAAGGQNRRTDSSVLDRVTLPTDRGAPSDWWYETHRRRLFGALARR